MTAQLSFFATAPKGVASILASELTQLGANGLKEQPAGVIFQGSIETAYRVCLWSRTANRVLYPLTSAEISSEDDLYAAVQSIDWSEHLAAQGTLAVDFYSSHSAITHSHYGALKVKDAIVDQFRESHGERPSVSINQPDIRINVHIYRNKATISIDLSGDSLHKRGYRRETVAAPLKENLAAALLLRAGWHSIAAEGGCLVDPMCGSGTILIEAAFIAANIAPNLHREHFGFSQWLPHNPALWQTLQTEANQLATEGLDSLPSIIGYDQNRGAIHAAIANIHAAGLHGHIHVERQAISHLTCPNYKNINQTGLIISNPPYGERLGELESLAPLYSEFGDRLKEHFVHWQFAMITGNPDLAKQLLIRAHKLYPLFNGTIECKLLLFNIQTDRFIDRPILSGGITMPRAKDPAELSDSAQMFANRLLKNAKNLKKWAKRNQISCYRLYDADLPDYALAIDLYEGHKENEQQSWLHVQEYEAPKNIDPKKASSRLRDALSVLPSLLNIPMERVSYKIRKKQKGTTQYEKQANERNCFSIIENGCTFQVNLTDYLDTGLFLDHRKTRELVGQLTPGKRFLNLFAYTGSATVYAIKAGAAHTTTIDLSNTYLSWAQRNMVLNGFKGEQHHFIQADCLEWLETESKQATAAPYDVIFLDPPTFSTSKRMSSNFDIERDHSRVIKQAAQLLSANGILIFSNNYRRFKMDIPSMPELTIEDITAKTMTKDFSRNKKIHNCWKVTLKARQ